MENSESYFGYKLKRWISITIPSGTTGTQKRNGLAQYEA